MKSLNEQTRISISLRDDMDGKVYRSWIRLAFAHVGILN